MRRSLNVTAGMLFLGMLCSCTYAPAPYYGGEAPYYGGAFVPGYAYGEGSLEYYPYYRNQHIYSGYNNGYWHHQYARGRGGFNGGHGGHGGGGHR